jgi:hypothetical protein
MTTAIGRSIAAAACTLLVIGAAHLAHDAAFCARHDTWARVQAHPSEAIRDSGYSVAREGDALYACVTPHTLGPITWHQDLDCYCAPAALGADEVGRLLGGRCTLDEAAPSRTDEAGACQRARCGEHLH